MGVCLSKKLKMNKQQSPVNKNLEKTFQKTKYYQEKYMKEVFDSEKQCEIKMVNVKTSQSTDAALNNSFLRRKALSKSRIGLSTNRKGAIPILNAKQVSFKDSFKQKYHKVIGLLLSNSNLSVVQNNQNQQLAICQQLRKNDEKDQSFIKWLKEKNIEHDNIVGVQEIQVDDQDYYIIYEYWVDQQLQNKTELEKAILINQMIESIQYLHDNDMRHSALTLNSFKLINNKPFGVLKLIELNQVHELSELSIESWKYLSPESLSALGNRSKARDVWALGIIALELLMNEHPFIKNVKEISIRKIMMKINSLSKQQIEQMLNNLNKDLKQLISGMICIDPQFRYTINECKTNIWLNKQINDYISSLQQPLYNFDKHKNNSINNIMARYYMVRILDQKQFNCLFILFQQLDLNKNGIITPTEIKNYYNSIYLPSSCKNDLINCLYSLPKDMEIHVKEFIGLTCDISQSKLKQYYTINNLRDLKLNCYLNQLNIPKRVINLIISDFNISELEQIITLDQFIQYII
ncbi:unnamed protein product [Paramecium pentaurelia]|uniref:Protein kinase domain-containing protein n=1 Tax=Paramecium pentaurelia TaxID=43138 RepID=A0A8S1WG03_9CILI|nr:unnamed protein product [Paramecium pentaurelia]